MIRSWPGAAGLAQAVSNVTWEAIQSIVVQGDEGELFAVEIEMHQEARDALACSAGLE